MELTAALGTDAGLFGLWSPPAFGSIVDYDSWEAALLEDDDIVGHIRAGVFVPINIGGDGAFQFLARVGSPAEPARLTEREQKYVVVVSEPYLFVAIGGAVVSGIEHVGAEPAAGLRIPLPAGRWQVAVALIDWGAEPGQRDSEGKPKPGALPDFTLLINAELGTVDEYRTRVDTFDRP